MTTIIVILAIWVLLSLPLSVMLGRAVTPDRAAPELVGMDGDVAVFRRHDGTEFRVSLGEHTVA